MTRLIPDAKTDFDVIPDNNTFLFRPISQCKFRFHNLFFDLLHPSCFLGFLFFMCAQRLVAFENKRSFSRINDGIFLFSSFSSFLKKVFGFYLLPLSMIILSSVFSRAALVWRKGFMNTTHLFISAMHELRVVDYINWKPHVTSYAW
jgi:hypothetical protein